MPPPDAFENHLDLKRTFYRNRLQMGAGRVRHDGTPWRLFDPLKQVWRFKIRFRRPEMVDDLDGQFTTD
jgi:hypothetical protein